MREIIVKYLRDRGIKIIMYMDDGSGRGNSFDNALESSVTIKSDLERLGLVLVQDNIN